MDVRDLVAGQDMDIQNETAVHRKLAPESLLQAKDQKKSSKSPLDVYWKWIVIAADNGLNLEHQLQGLPSSTANIAAYPVLLQDNVATVMTAKLNI